MQARDWAGVGELLAEDVVVEWPVSGERIHGRENFVRINAEYPEGWLIKILRVLSSGNEVVSEVEFLTARWASTGWHPSGLSVTACHQRP
ncbi:nuclear transport factor 2 family protein [Streptomyces sp. NBC_01591]|uniref:nuclear transport factor 2 family protein n=1 Tax=Streptomyces sp. NBC_01591 TaxID=2975888 RepID=UPI002DD83C3E|nr:nuclear transport factor 2 family protein [Streptomyces sp. NBC_01591]WSD66457.1 nuclear transport factor 2 family protein [Streptomyces sp. NBC_01591]